MIVFIAALLICCASAAATESSTKQRDCSDHKEWRGYDMETECDLSLGPVCPNMVQWCDTWAKGPNGPVYQAETARLRTLYQEEQKGANLLNVYLGLPTHWRTYSMYALGDGYGFNENAVIRALSAVDAGNATPTELRRVAEFEEAMKRAQAIVYPSLKPEDFIPNLNWKLAH